jgi:hypothetical protein
MQTLWQGGNQNGGMEMKHIDKMTGYKATDKDMTCQGFQFELGKWYEHKGELEFCKSGFHFCRYPSGVWAYYNKDGTRVFKVEARDVIEEYTPGADLKLVCREIRLVSEIEITGHSNTGDSNTGDSNTGDRNTGNWNTGDRNTGNWNTGHLNTGDRNTGNWNTGYWNTGFFCTETPKPTFFDLPFDGTHDEARNLIPYVELPVGAIWTPTSQMTDAEKAENPNHVTIGGYLRASELTIQQAFPLAWAKMTNDEKQQWLSLPNFNAEKFFACTGVDVRKPEPADTPARC